MVFPSDALQPPKNSVEIINLLINAKADINLKNNRGQTAKEIYEEFECRECKGESKIACQRCRGEGGWIIQKQLDCNRCKGRGEVSGVGRRMEKCNDCNGTGKGKLVNTRETCPQCKGTKTVQCTTCDKLKTPRFLGNQNNRDETPNNRNETPLPLNETLSGSWDYAHGSGRYAITFYPNGTFKIQTNLADVSGTWRINGNNFIIKWNATGPAPRRYKTAGNATYTIIKLTNNEFEFRGVAASQSGAYNGYNWTGPNWVGKK